MADSTVGRTSLCVMTHPCLSASVLARSVRSSSSTARKLRRRHRPSPERLELRLRSAFLRNSAAISSAASICLLSLVRRGEVVDVFGNRSRARARRSPPPAMSAALVSAAFAAARARASSATKNALSDRQRLAPASSSSSSSSTSTSTSRRIRPRSPPESRVVPEGADFNSPPPRVPSPSSPSAPSTWRRSASTISLAPTTITSPSRWYRARRRRPPPPPWRRGATREAGRRRRHFPSSFVSSDVCPTFVVRFVRVRRKTGRRGEERVRRRSRRRRRNLRGERPQVVCSPRGDRTRDRRASRRGERARGEKESPARLLPGGVNERAGWMMCARSAAQQKLGRRVRHVHLPRQFLRRVEL